MKKIFKQAIPAFAGMTIRVVFIVPSLLILSCGLVAAEILSIEGKPAKEGDIIQVRLCDVHPTQPSVGFDEIYYKVGRFTKDRRKIFREYCKHNGQLEIRDFTDASTLRDPASFRCLEPIGMTRNAVKTVVIAPNGQLYLTNGHHSFIELWQMPDGGPDVRMNVVVGRDYRSLPTMDDFWTHMKSEQNVWLYDPEEQPTLVEDLPASFALANFQDDPYRSLMYFTRKIAWNSPEKFQVPDEDYNFPQIPFAEFYWAHEVRKVVDLAEFDLTSHDGYIAAMRAVGRAIITIRASDIGGSGKNAKDMGQFAFFNEKELNRLDRPGTGKLAYMLEYKTALLAQAHRERRDQVEARFNTSAHRPIKQVTDSAPLAIQHP